MATFYQLVLLVAVLFIGALIYLRFFYVDVPKIAGIKEIPGASLVSGHLFLLGDDHASTAEHWSEVYSSPLFQIRLGNRRTIIINSFDLAKDWSIKHQSALLDRPWLYTFHGVLSKTSASTIGTSPWNNNTKKQRRIVGSLTTAPAIRRHQGMLDLETWQMISDIYEDSQKGTKEISPHIYQKRLSLNIMMMFCYANRFANINDGLLRNILDDASVISSFRSTNANAQDYIPFLRIWNNDSRSSIAKAVRARRDKWLSSLLQTVRDQLNLKEFKNCVAKGLLIDDEERLTRQDVRTILGGLMSGGFETVFATTIAGIAFLASPEGQAIQQRAYEDILQVYGSIEEAFEGAISEEKSEYVVAFVRETLRYYPPLHLLPPRQTFEEFQYQGSTIPKGVMVLLNAQAINHDKATYGEDADVFRPERWLEKDPEKQIPAPFHFSYGAGGRMCTAVNFSNRILYATFLRLIVSFNIVESPTARPCTHFIDYNNDKTAQAAIPKDFRATFKVRDAMAFEKCMETSKKATEEFTNAISKEVAGDVGQE